MKRPSLSPKCMPALRGCCAGLRAARTGGVTLFEQHPSSSLKLSKRQRPSGSQRYEDSIHPGRGGA